MKLKYINRIKANISIYSSKLSTNILEGTYKSVYKGKSMNFENLREYVINDDIKDIDWKSSARSGTILVREFIAEKKHNILIIMDSGLKMEADTDAGENKKEVALSAAGTIGYLAIKNGDYVGFCHYSNDKIIFKPFKDTLYKLEEYLCFYDMQKPTKNSYNLNSLLEYVYKNITKKMIIFIITDIGGLNEVKNKTIKELNAIHDIMFININDSYMFGSNIFDIEENAYIPKIFTEDTKLNEYEKNIRQELYQKNLEKLRHSHVCLTSISSQKEINLKLIELLEEHKYANNN